jgi:hypothetical protein
MKLTFTQDVSRIGMTVLQEYVEDGETFRYDTGLTLKRIGNNRCYPDCRNLYNTVEWKYFWPDNCVKDRFYVTIIG